MRQIKETGRPTNVTSRLPMETDSGQTRRGPRVPGYRIASFCFSLMKPGTGEGFEPSTPTLARGLGFLSAEGRLGICRAEAADCRQTIRFEVGLPQPLASLWPIVAKPTRFCDPAC
jgi:hypothetical protein